MKAGAPPTRQGGSLIEVLLALALIGGVSTAALQAQAHTERHRRYLQQHWQAQWLAQDLFERLQASPRSGGTEPVLPPGQGLSDWAEQLHRSGHGLESAHWELRRHGNTTTLYIDWPSPLTDTGCLQTGMACRQWTVAP